MSAPVIIDGDNYIENVVLRQTSINTSKKTARLYLHDVNLIQVDKKSGTLSFIDPDLKISGTWATNTTSTDSVSKTESKDSSSRKKDLMAIHLLSQDEIIKSDQNINNLTQQEIDTYNQALESGDMETAQQIVNIAAE